MQTNDDNIEKDTQTEETTSRDKWTQHPPGVDALPFGGSSPFWIVDVSFVHYKVLTVCDISVTHNGWPLGYSYSMVGCYPLSSQ